MIERIARKLFPRGVENATLNSEKTNERYRAWRTEDIAFIEDFARYSYLQIQEQFPEATAEQILHALTQTSVLMNFVIYYAFHKGKTVIIDYEDAVHDIALYFKNNPPESELQEAEKQATPKQDSIPKRKKPRNPYAPGPKKGFIPPTR